MQYSNVYMAPCQLPALYGLIFKRLVCSRDKEANLHQQPLRQSRKCRAGSKYAYMCAHAQGAGRLSQLSRTDTLVIWQYIETSYHAVETGRCVWSVDHTSAMCIEEIIQVRGLSYSSVTSLMHKFQHCQLWQCSGHITLEDLPCAGSSLSQAGKHQTHFITMLSLLLVVITSISFVDIIIIIVGITPFAFTALLTLLQEGQ